MAKTPKTAPAEDQQAGLPSAQPADAPVVTTTEGEVPPDPDPNPEPEPSTAYERAVTFTPDPWDQLPEDQEVRDLYLALNGQVTFFIKRRA
jgi:hypothetical protein